MFRTSSVHHQERFVQAVFADFGMCCNTRTTRHVQPLQSCRKNCMRFSMKLPSEYESVYLETMMSYVTKASSLISIPNEYKILEKE